MYVAYSNKYFSDAVLISIGIKLKCALLDKYLFVRFLEMMDELVHEKNKII